MLKDSKKRNMFVRIMFVVYAIAMAYFLFFRHGFNVGGTYWEVV